MKTTKNSLLAFSLLFLFLLTACEKKETVQVPIGDVTRGTFYIDMYEEGEIEAINSYNIAAPMIWSTLKIANIVKDGTEVNAGDTLIVFDPSEVQKRIIEAEGRLEISLAELDKLIAQQEADREEMEIDYEIASLAQQIARIRFESAIYESEMKRKEMELSLEKSETALVRNREQIENRIKIQKEDMKQTQLSIQQDRKRLQESYETLEKLNVVTPSAGIAIIGRNWTNNKYQIGDQCWQGQSLIQLPDLSELKATIKINEVDIAKIVKGLEVEIRPDAFSDSIFKGHVNSVANLAVNKEYNSKIKVFPVEIYIDGTSPNLLPGLTVSCRILIDKVEDALFVPIDAVHQEADKYFVYRKSGGGFNKQEVEVGQTNSDHIIILSGLDEKDKVALVNPFATEEGEVGTSESQPVEGGL